MDSIQHGEHASDSGADGESQNHAEIVSGLTELFFFLIPHIHRQRCGSASQVSDAHGACIRITADLAEGLYLNRARKRYEHRREHIVRGRNKSDDRKDHNFRREKYLPPVQPLCIPVMLLEIFCQKYTHRKKEDREELPKACRKVSFQKVLAHQHNVSRLGI